MHMCTIWLQVPWRPEEGIGTPGIVVTGGCEPSGVGAGN